MEGREGSPYALAGKAAARPGPQPTAAEAAAPAPDRDMGDAEPGAPAATFDHLAEKRGRASTGTLPGLSGLPRREPETFDGFDFSRTRGRDAGALAKPPALAGLYAHRDVALMGPGGIGKAHLARACGRECCMRGLKTYYVKANEPGDRFQGAAGRGSAQRAVATLARPSCLIVDEVGRCVFDRACADLFFDVIDRRHERGAQHHDPHEQHGAELLGRVPRGGRGPALCARQGIRQGIGLHDARPELPRPRARHLLGRGGAAGDEGQGDAARGSVATT